jgi:hypothetical protein
MGRSSADRREQTVSQTPMPGSLVPATRINSERLHLFGIDTVLCTVLDQSLLKLFSVLLRTHSAILIYGSSASEP